MTGASSRWLSHLCAIPLVAVFITGCTASPPEEVYDRHRDLGTTQRYMHLSPAALEAAIRLLERSEPQSRGAHGEAAGTSG